MPSQSWIVASQIDLSLPATAQLRIQLVGGSVTVTERAEPGVSIRIEAVVGSPLEVAQTPTEVSVGYPTIGWDGWLKRLAAYRSQDSAEVTVELGPGAGVRVAAVSARVQLVGIASDSSIGTADGPVACENGQGSLTARTISGSISVSAHDGPVRVNTVSGEVSVSGAIPRLDLAAVSGRASLLTTRASSVIRAQTVSGAVGVNVPATAGVDLKARAVSASVMLDGVERRSSSGPGSVHVTERGSGEAAFVDIVTVTGPVSVARADSA